MNQLSRKEKEVGATFTPSKGPVGSVFALSGNRENPEHQYYCRTPWGIQRVQAPVGASLLFRQIVVRRQLAFHFIAVPILLLVILALALI